MISSTRHLPLALLLLSLGSLAGSPALAGGRTAPSAVPLEAADTTDRLIVKMRDRIVRHPTSSSPSSAGAWARVSGTGA